jgi:hypothetical protein
MSLPKHPSRRNFLATSASIVAGACLCGKSHAAATQPATQEAGPVWDGPIIDIHQHTNYHGRSNEGLFHHQKRMGVTQTILLPAGSDAITESTLKGKANGLYAGTGSNDTVVPIAESHPNEYFYFANEVPDLPHARQTIEHYLKRGAIGIGEQKFNVPCNGEVMEMVYSLAREYRVPVLMHFQYEMFNTGFENLGKVLEKWHDVTFIGHA